VRHVRAPVSPHPGWGVFARFALGVVPEVAWCGEGHIADEHDWEIVAKEAMPDHVHLFVRVRPSDAPAAVVRAFKGRTARVLRQEFPHLRNHAQVLWSPSYFAASVGYVSESTVRRYIEHQWDAVAS
jgi:putative transposase